MSSYRVKLFLRGGHRFETTMSEEELAELGRAHGGQSGLICFKVSGGEYVEVLGSNLIAIQYHASDGLPRED